MNFTNYITKGSGQVSDDSIIVATSIIKDNAILDNVTLGNHDYLYADDADNDFCMFNMKLLECVICDYAHLHKVNINIQQYIGHPILYITGYSYLHNIRMYIKPESFNHNDYILFYNSTISITNPDCTLLFNIDEPISFFNINIIITNHNIDKYIQFFKDHYMEITDNDLDKSCIKFIDMRAGYTEYEILLTKDNLLALSNI
jgi:hypothetical protein